MRELKEGSEWATVPLLDQSNVGKYVWTVFNGNDKQATPNKIVKVGRTNIHVGGDGHNPDSYRVTDDGLTANGMHGGYTISAESQQYRLEREERVYLMRALDDIVKELKKSRDIEKLRKAVRDIGFWVN